MILGGELRGHTGIVEEFEGDYVVRLERERMPRLQLSPTYRKLLKEAKSGDQTEVWLKKSETTAPRRV